MNKRFSAFVKMLVLALGLVGLFVISSSDKKGEATGELNSNSDYESAYDFAMGTSISAQVYSSLDNENQVRQQVFQAIKDLDENIISWRASDSELGRLNSSYEAGTAWEVSEELYTAIDQSLSICKDSEGALDITIRPLADVWGIESDDEFVPPTETDIKSGLENVGYEYVETEFIQSDNHLNTGDTENNNREYNFIGTVTLSREDIIIDLGATGKGYALDIVKSILVDSKVEGALVTVGGSIMVYGSKPESEPWRIGVRDPKGASTDDMIGYLEFEAGTNICISTSGGYEKYKVYEGKEYHHILDRNTGYPAVSELSSVTIVCDNGLVSDGLSTACFVLGYEKSLPLLEKYGAEAVFIDLEGNITVTEGLKANWVEE